MRCPFSQRQQHRVGVLLHYTLNWLRQEENQYLSCPPEAAKALSAELRALMAYTKGGYVLGICSWDMFLGYSEPTPPGKGKELAPPEHLFGEKPQNFAVSISTEELVEGPNKGKQPQPSATNEHAA